MRKIYKETFENRAVTVYWNSDFSEYQCKLSVNGVRKPDATYFTNDEDDAIDTAATMVRPIKTMDRIRAFEVPGAPLDRRFNVACQHIVSRVLPCGFDVANNAPSTYESLVDHYERTGRVVIWSGASAQTIFACPETNYMFRAWHDARHISGKHDFSLAGKTCTMWAQQNDIHAIYGFTTMANRFCAILEAEILGQALYESRHGGFPVDQHGFVTAYLANWRTAVDNSDFGISPCDS